MNTNQIGDHSISNKEEITMTIHKSMSEIESSLMNRIEQHSNKESLEVAVQIEDHDDLYDVAVLLYGSS